MAALFTATPLCGSVTIQGKRMSILFMTGTLLTVVGTTWVASLFNSWRKRRQVERIYKAKRQQNLKAIEEIYSKLRNDQVSWKTPMWIHPPTDNTTIASAAAMSSSSSSSY